MTSILTNNAAMAALQTLRTISSGMEETQARVSSGLRVGEAADNAAYWSIATTMRSDNGALSAVQDALGLGAAKVDTAYAGLESSIEVVKEIKNKLVAAREAGVDRNKIQQEIEQLQGQLKSISSSASFSGENWLQASVSTPNANAGDVADAATVTKQVVGSFTRDSAGNVKVQSIDVELTSSNVMFDTSGNKMAILDQEALKADVAKYQGAYYTAETSLDATYAENADGIWVSSDTGTYPNVYVKVDESKWVQVTSDTDATVESSLTPLTAITDIFVTDTSIAELDITKLGAVKADFFGAAAATASDEDVLDLLISHVDRQLEAATGAAADMGSVAMRLDLQEDFVSKLSDSIDSGIGRLVDADMNEESTRLKALQTQQQLGIQSLSIANSASENILTLFR